MSITLMQVESLIHKLLPDKCTDILRLGIERGLELYRERDKNNRDDLDEYSRNLSTRDLYSSICVCLQKTVNASDCMCAHAVPKTSSVYIEIENDDVLIHLINDRPDKPDYVKNCFTMNADFESGHRHYVQLLYKARKGEILERVRIAVPDENGHIVWRAPLHGNWETSLCA